MKIYISADIEGITGIAHWDEATKGKSDYGEFREQMTAEVVAACEGALDAGAAEIWVKDAHGSGRNLIASKLPEQARLIRGWAGHPFSMVQGLDETFDALIMVGYHSPAGSDTNPLAHTMSGGVTYIKVNAQYASEFLLHAYAAALVDVPTVFVSGDAGLCEAVQTFNPNIGTYASLRGVGNSTVSVHPALAARHIREGVKQAVQGDVANCCLELPRHFSVEIGYKKHPDAYSAAFYPGVSLEKPHVIHFNTEDYFEVLRLIKFTV